MKILIEATDTITDVDGVPVRLWEGWTENGIPCAVLVHRIVTLDSGEAAKCFADLQDQKPPANSPSLAIALSEMFLRTAPDIPFRGAQEHPEDYDGPCLCDSCISHGAD
jgi:hypothetical protein